MTRTEELMKLAEAATPGPWRIIEDSLGGKDEAWCFWHCVGPFDLMGEMANANDKFIAAANPETIKQLVELCRLQHEAIDSVLWANKTALCEKAEVAFNKLEGGE